MGEGVEGSKWARNDNMEDVERRRVKESELVMEGKSEAEMFAESKKVAEDLLNAKFSVSPTQNPPPKPAPENSAPQNRGTEIATSKKHAIQDIEVLSPAEQKQYLASLLVKANAAALEALINGANEGVDAEAMKDLANAAATMTDTLLAVQWNQMLLDRAKDKLDTGLVQQGPQVGGRLVAKLVGKAGRVDKLAKGDGRETPNKLAKEVLGPQDD